MLKAELTKKLPNFDLDVEVEAKPGQVIGIMGPSGCGKSMFLGCLAGLQHPECGKITLDDDVWLDTEKKIDKKTELRHAGYCFQNFALFENRSALENIMAGFSGKYRSRKMSKAEKKEKALELLKLVGLEKAASQYPATLSGGQKQRIALARLMADHPRLWLLDEPFSAVDTQFKEDLYEALKSILQEAGVPVFLCSHDPRDIQALCTDYIRMENGKITERGVIQDEQFIQKEI